MVDPRYIRQARLPQLGEQGQARLAQARVHVVGVGALGCPAADLLTRAGIGTIRLIDRDIVETSNLHRQTLFTEADVGRSKSQSAAARLREVSASVLIEPVAADVSPQSLDRVFQELDPARDLILDCTDNFETRYLLNDLAISTGTPLVYAGAIATGGMVMPIRPSHTACLRCVFPDIPATGSQPTCESAGVLGPASAMIGSLQAAQAIRLIVAPDTPAKLLSVDAWTLETQSLDTNLPDPECPSCGYRRFPFLTGRESSEARLLCGRDAVHIDPAQDLAIDLDTLQHRLSSEGSFDRSPDLIRGTIADGTRLTIFEDGRAIFDGITEPDRARALYARLIGS